MAIPQLTWNFVGPMALVSGSKVSAGGNLREPGAFTATAGQSPIKAYMMDTLRRLINASTYWVVDVQDVTGSATEALVLKPDPTKTQTPSMRVIVTMNVSGAAGGSSTAQTMQNRAQTSTTTDTVETATANNLLIGFSPDISPNKTWVTGSWNSDRPWGTNVRWSKYWSMYDGSTTVVDQMYLIESSETLFIGVKARKGSTDHFFGHAGAIMQSADSGSGEQVTGSTGRVYGMSTGAVAVVNAAWLNTTTQGPFGYSATALATHTGVWVVSGGNPNTQIASGQANVNTWELCARAASAQPSLVSDTSTDRSTNVTSAETLVGWPIPVVSAQTPVRFIGFARQTYMIGDTVGLVAIATGTNNPSIIGYTWSEDITTANDAILFSSI